MFQGRKVLTLLISLLAAFLLWLYVVTTIAPETTATVGSIPVTIDGYLALEERNLMITDQATQTISLELSTSRVNFSKLNAETIRISADASKIREAGIYDLSYTITFPDTVNSNDIDILRKSTNTVTITVEKVETKTIPIKLNWTGSVKDGYLFDAENVLIEPEVVVLTGPTSELAQIDSAQVSYEISELDQTQLEVLPITYLNAEKEAVELSENTSANLQQVSVTFPVQRTKEITLRVELIPGGGVMESSATVEYEPETIRVKGAAAIVDGMDDMLTLGSIDLANVLDKEDYEFNLNLPAGVICISGETSAKVHVTISGVYTANLYVSNINLINAPEDYQVDLTTRTTLVTVRGTKAEIESLRNSMEDIYIQVDLSNYTQKGEFTVPGKVIIVNHPNLGIVGSVEIGVIIREIEAEPEE